tara:strand:+ start:1593 stop:1778 length:186 start_codon:yes stop_codon:yes gene_type:complete
MDIQTKTVTSFGTERVYVIDSYMAEVIGKLTGKKTVNQSDLIALQMLGHTVNGLALTNEVA